MLEKFGHMLASLIKYDKPFGTLVLFKTQSLHYDFI